MNLQDFANIIHNKSETLQLQTNQTQTMTDNKKPKILQCPDCNQLVLRDKIRQHIQECKVYRKKYLTSMTKTIDITSKNDLRFLFAELQMIKQKIQGVFSDSDNDEENINRHNSLKLSIQQPQNNFPTQNSIQSSLINQTYLSQKLKPKLQQFSQRQASNLQKKQSINSNKKNQNMSAFDRILSKKKNQNLQAKNIIKIEQNNNKPQSKELDFMDELFQIKKQNQNKIKYEEQTTICSKCNRHFTMNQIEEFIYADFCLHPVCKKCMETYLEKQYINAKGKYKYPCPYPFCQQQIPYYQLAEIFGRQRMEKIDNELMNGYMNDLVDCLKCKSKFEFMKGRPEDAPKVSEDGKKVGPKYLEEFANNRFLCPNCKTQQCKTCKNTPYHIGKTCQEYKIMKTQKKCRYCNQALPLGYLGSNGIRAFEDICNSEQCSLKVKNACSKVLKCGHSCNGFIKQKKCLPCLKENCAMKNSKQLNDQNQGSYCNICFVEGLGNAPCVKTKCGHIFHYDCLLKRLKTKWFGPRILFNFCHCPLCKEWIQVPPECQLSKILQNCKQIQKQVRQKALKRLKFQKDDQNQKLKDPKSEYFKNQQKYAMAIYAYFQCWKCKKPYFGGRKNCADAMNDNREGGDAFKPEQLICPQCCPVEVNNCSKHGKEFISFKCKFCCSIAQWFCWGSTHFCDPCHKRQVSGQYLNKIPKQKLPKCEGVGKCPIGGNHDGNGQTKSLGCSLCNNLVAIQSF